MSFRNQQEKIYGDLLYGIFQEEGPLCFDVIEYLKILPCITFVAFTEVYSSRNYYISLTLTTLAYVTYQDIQKISGLKDQTVIVVKAPPETRLEVPDPVEVRKSCFAPSAETGGVDGWGILEMNHCLIVQVCTLLEIEGFFLIYSTYPSLKLVNISIIW